MVATQLPGEKFEVHVPQEALDDLRDRLVRTRFPDRQAGSDWATGTPLGYARRLRDYWLNEFDWRKCEGNFNAFTQRMVTVEGHPIHVIVEKGSGSAPMPLLLAHGWPSSFVEFAGLIDRLAHPERYGGDPESGFTVLIPSMPGYGFSPAPETPVSPDEIARFWAVLMREVFGFERYVAFGCDWGSAVIGAMAARHHEGLAGILLSTSGGIVDIGDGDEPLSEEEGAWLSQLQAKMYPESGYQLVQGTKPQSLAYAHTDSPMGLACWIVEKFHGWTVPGSPEDPPFSMDDLLANIMIYWVNGCLAPMWLYMYLGAFRQSGGRSPVPAGFFFAPNDLVPPAPKRYLERMYSDIRHYRVLDSGGHFPGLEYPETLIAEIQNFLGQCK